MSSRNPPNARRPRALTSRSATHEYYLNPKHKNAQMSATGPDDDTFHDFFPEFTDVRAGEHDLSVPTFEYPGLTPGDPEWADKMMTSLRARKDETLAFIATLTEHAEKALVEASLAEAEVVRETREVWAFLDQLGDLVGPRFRTFLEEELARVESGGDARGGQVANGSHAEQRSSKTREAPPTPGPSKPVKSSMRRPAGLTTNPIAQSTPHNESDVLPVLTPQAFKTPYKQTSAYKRKRGMKGYQNVDAGEDSDGADGDDEKERGRKRKRVAEMSDPAEESPSPIASHIERVQRTVERTRHTDGDNQMHWAADGPATPGGAVQVAGPRVSDTSASASGSRMGRPVARPSGLSRQPTFASLADESQSSDPDPFAFDTLDEEHVPSASQLPITPPRFNPRLPSSPAGPDRDLESNPFEDPGSEDLSEIRAQLRAEESSDMPMPEERRRPAPLTRQQTVFFQPRPTHQPSVPSKLRRESTVLLEPSGSAGRGAATSASSYSIYPEPLPVTPVRQVAVPRSNVPAATAAQTSQPAPGPSTDAEEDPEEFVFVQGPLLREEESPAELGQGAEEPAAAASAPAPSPTPPPVPSPPPAPPPALRGGPLTRDRRRLVPLDGETAVVVDEREMRNLQRCYSQVEYEHRMMEIAQKVVKKNGNVAPW